MQRLGTNVKAPTHPKMATHPKMVHFDCDLATFKAILPEQTTPHAVVDASRVVLVSAKRKL
jgi:hypothetical protein